MTRDVWQALVAHDLKNALGSLEARLAQLAADPAPRREDAAEAHRQCHALRQRLVALLTLQRAEAEGGLAAWCNDEDPVGLLERVREGTRAGLAPGRDLQIDLSVNGPPAPWGHFDATLVQLAIEAALHNAARHAHRRVELSTGLREGGVWLAVADDGPGLDRGRTTEQRGHPEDRSTRTGLGTALCQAVAEAHRLQDRCGRIRLADEGLARPDGGRGARFELWLP